MGDSIGHGWGRILYVSRERCFLGRNGVGFNEGNMDESYCQPRRVRTCRASRNEVGQVGTEEFIA